MSDSHDIRAELAAAPSGEREELVEVAARLAGSRPAPPAALEGERRRRVLAAARREPLSPPLRRLALSYAASGLVLLAIAASGLVGAGPFAP